MLKIVLAIFQLKRLGGRERDCLELAKFLHARGHQVVIVTTLFDTLNCPVPVVAIEISGWVNHARVAQFAAAVQQYKVRNSPDVLMTFERMGGADFWYAADIAVKEEADGLWSWKPRRHSRLSLEAGLFAEESRTHAFFLTSEQRRKYSQHYEIPPSRSSILPIVVHRDRLAAAERSKDESFSLHKLLGIPEKCLIAISICLNPKLKGVDRTLEALAQFPETHFVVVGATDHWIRRRANLLGIGHCVHLIPYRSEIMHLLSAADFMIHPARLEAAGQVIVEAILAGVPCIVSSDCGYSPEIKRLGAGIVFPDPFAQADLVGALATMIHSLGTAKKLARDASNKIALAADDWLQAIAERIEGTSDIPSDIRAEPASLTNSILS